MTGQRPAPRRTPPAARRDAGSVHLTAPRFPEKTLRPEPPATFVLELPTTADFAEGGLGRQCAVLCKAGCCRYYSLPIATPRTDAELDDVRWYLMHEGTHVYKHEGDWHLLVMNECRNLLPNNLCGVYDDRPRICSEYDATDCEYTGEITYELYFENERQFEGWLAERKARRRGRPAKGAARAGARSGRER